jgi:hypothetical protein
MTHHRTAQFTDYTMYLRFLRSLFASAFALGVFLTGMLHAQGITTSSLNGIVTDRESRPVSGATVTIVHEPSGTRAETITRANGRFAVWPASRRTLYGLGRRIRR